MLTRLYVENFRALVSTDLTLGPRTLLMGANGTGKSTIGEVLVRIQGLLFGQARTDHTFTADTLTRWQQVPQQRVELDVSGPAGTYRYDIVVEHRDPPSPDEPRTRIRRECLALDSRPLFQFEDGTVRLFRD